LNLFKDPVHKNKIFERKKEKFIFLLGHPLCEIQCKFVNSYFGF